MEPTVAAIIPVYNGAATLERAVDSVRLQTHQCDEIIIVDDGSTDATSDVLRRLERRVRCSLIVQENRGVAAARNAAVARSRTTYVAFLDADDEWDARKIERQVMALREHPDAALCTTRFFLRGPSHVSVHGALSARGTEGLQRDFEATFRHPYFGTPTVVMRKDVFCELEGFNEGLKCAEDLDLWLRVAFRFPIVHLEEPLVTVHSRRESLTLSRGIEPYLDNIAVIDSFVQNHREFFSARRRLVGAVRAVPLERIGVHHLLLDEPRTAARYLLQALHSDPWSWKRYAFLVKAVAKMALRSS